MNVNLRHKTRLSYDVIEHILLSRGVDESMIGKYLKVDKSMKPTYCELDNIDKAVQLLKKHIDKQSKIYIQVDTDADGMTSASIMYQFLVNDLEVDENLVVYYMPNTKLHGLTLDKILEEKPNLVIAPDASSSEFDIHETLHNEGIDVLVLDHHLVDENRYSEHATVVNNQLSEQFKHKALTGANIVLLFLEAYIDTFKEDIDTDKYLDLATVGMIADRGSLLDESVFYYTQVGLKKLNNPLIKLILDKDNNIVNDRDLTTKDIEFSVAPLINAVTRQGQKDDLDVVLGALFNRDYMVYNKRLKEDRHVVEEAYRRMTNARSRQNNTVKNALESIKERIEEKQTHLNKVLLVNSTGIVENSGTNGLIAIKLAEEYKRPTLVMNVKGDMLKGSARNFNNSPIPDLKSEIEKSKIFDYALGHASAFGVGITLKNAMEAIDTLNEQLEHIDYDLTYIVDIEYDKVPNVHEIHDIAKHSRLWGNHIEEPKVYIKNIQVKKDNIRILGKTGNTLKIDLGVCDALKFRITEEDKVALVGNESDMLELDIVGKCSLNTYRGMDNPQIIIEDFTVLDINNTNPFEEIDKFNSEALPF